MCVCIEVIGELPKREESKRLEKKKKKNKCRGSFQNLHANVRSDKRRRQDRTRSSGQTGSLLLFSSFAAASSSSSLYFLF